MSIDLIFSFFGIVNIALRTSAIDQSEIIEDQNLYRKNYIVTGGEALIFYAIKAQKRSFFSGNSFSLPLYVTYPVYCIGKRKKLVFRLMGGTNILLPGKITLEAEQGWDRFGEKEVKEIFDLGELKEVEWFGGIGIEGSPTKSTRLSIEFMMVYADYQEDFEVPVVLEFKNELRPSVSINFTKLFKL